MNVPGHCTAPHRTAVECYSNKTLEFPVIDLLIIFANTLFTAKTNQTGSIGVVVGGIVSDKIVAKMGIKSRVAVLAISQLIATPGAFGSVYFDPLWAMITLGLSYFFGRSQKENRLQTIRKESLIIL